MMALTLARVVNGADYTLGKLLDADGKQVCVTTERAWVDVNGDGIGDRNLSRIPAGTYACHRALHHSRYQVWELENVPGRANIHIHIGNSPRVDTKGCILVGTAYAEKGTIANSFIAFERLMRLTEGHDQITLTVTDAQ